MALFSWWKLDESNPSTTAADASGNGRAGTTGSVNHFNSGKINKCWISNVAAPQITAGWTGPSNTTWSVTWWVYKDLDTLSSCDYTISHGDLMKTYVVGGPLVYCSFYVRNTSSAIIYQYDALVDNAIAWHHYSYVRDGNVYTFYVDGLQVDQHTIAGGSTFTAYNSITQNTPAAGTVLVDEVRVYNQALTAANVLEIYYYDGSTTSSTSTTSTSTSTTSTSTSTSSTTTNTYSTSTSTSSSTTQSTTTIACEDFYSLNVLQPPDNKWVSEIYDLSYCLRNIDNIVAYGGDGSQYPYRGGPQLGIIADFSGLPSCTVTGVTVRVYARKSTVTAVSFKVGVKTGGIWYYGPDTAFTLIYAWYEYTWTTNPNTLQPWTRAEVVAAGYGGYLTSSVSIGAIADQLAVRVCYDTLYTSTTTSTSTSTTSTSTSTTSTTSTSTTSTSTSTTSTSTSTTTTTSTTSTSTSTSTSSTTTVSIISGYALWKTCDHATLPDNVLMIGIE